MDNDDKYMVLDYLFNYNLELVKEYSMSIYNSLNIGWENFVVNKNKNKKYKETIEKHLIKLEKKKIDVSIILKENENILDYLQSYGLLNSKYKSSLLSGLRDAKSISDIFRFLVNSYADIVIRDKNKSRKKINVDMPYQVKMKNYYVTDKDGYNYNHVKLVNGAMVVVDSSLKVEKQLYNIAINDNKELFKDSKEIKLAPFEKKRRIYVENIFNLEKDILNLEDKEIDITYPLEVYYAYSKKLVDGLYHELSRRIIKNDIFDYIMCVTYDNFNYENVVAVYGKIVNNVNSKIKKLERNTKNVFIDDTLRIKKNVKYSDFKHIEGLMPGARDIYNAVNKKIINKLHINYQSDIKLMEEYVNKSTKFMNESDIVEYYNSYKNVLSINTSSLESFKVLQKCIVKVLEKKFHIDKKIIFKDVIKEQKIY